MPVLALCCPYTGADRFTDVSRGAVSLAGGGSSLLRTSLLGKFPC